MLPFKYRPGADVGLLEDWSFDNPASNYRIVRGAPKTSGRLDAGGAGQTTRYGIWRCTVGAFECTEQGDELMSLTTELSEGDSYFVRDGSRVTWDVSEDLTKVFFGHRSDGY